MRKVEEFMFTISFPSFGIIKQKNVAEEEMTKREDKMRNKKSKRWERFDNTAHLFPIIAGDDTSNVYRVSVVLKEKVKPELLQQALDEILPFFPGFNMRMRRGFFWYYFEENTKAAPEVRKEDTYPCQFIVENRNRNYQFRVTYYNMRINLEVFHALSDGMGAINFLKELTYKYIRLAYIGDTSHLQLSSETSLNRADDFMRNYRKKQPKPYKTEKAFIIKGDKLPKKHLAVIHGILKISQVKDLCKKYDCSINELMAATFAYSIYREYNQGNKAIRIAIPVNLRPYFVSVTTKNFFAMVSTELKSGTYTFDQVVEITKETLRKQINREYLEKLFSYNVSNQMNLIARTVPLPLKNIAIRNVFVSAARASTSTMTNIGNIKVEQEYERFIESFHAILPMSMGQNLKATVCSYGDYLNFTFSSRLQENHVQRRFFTTLAERGLDVTIETNGEYYG